MSDQGALRRRYVFFALAALGSMMGSIDMTIVAVAIPTLTRSLNTSLNWIGWTLTSYQLAQIVAMPLAGKLSDELGRKRVFMFCVGTFTLGSLLCGLAPNVGFLILFRVIQAIGGGGLAWWCWLGHRCCCAGSGRTRGASASTYLAWPCSPVRCWP